MMRHRGLNDSSSLARISPADYQTWEVEILYKDLKADVLIAVLKLENNGGWDVLLKYVDSNSGVLFKYWSGIGFVSGSANQFCLGIHA